MLFESKITADRLPAFFKKRFDDIEPNSQEFKCMLTRAVNELKVLVDEAIESAKAEPRSVVPYVVTSDPGPIPKIELAMPVYVNRDVPEFAASLLFKDGEYHITRFLELKDVAVGSRLIQRMCEDWFLKN